MQLENILSRRKKVKLVKKNIYMMSTGKNNVRNQLILRSEYTLCENCVNRLVIVVKKVIKIGHIILKNVKAFCFKN